MISKQPISFQSNSTINRNSSMHDSPTITNKVIRHCRRRRCRRHCSNHPLASRKRRFSASLECADSRYFLSPVCKLSRFMLNSTRLGNVNDHEIVGRERKSNRLRMKKRLQQQKNYELGQAATSFDLQLPLLQNTLSSPSKLTPTHLANGKDSQQQIMSPSVSQAIKKLETVDVNKRPNELIRYDFISAMKLPERHVLLPEEFWLLQDKWKAAWHRGVHVPISTTPAKDLYKCERIQQSNLSSILLNAEYLPAEQEVLSMSIAHFTNDVIYRQDDTEETTSDKLTARLNIHNWINCLYDVDCMDLYWISCIQCAGVNYSVDQFERCIIALEFTCAEQMRSKISQSLTFDNDIVCDVCRSPDAHDGDEMVFCDGCNLCVHQSCYGIKQVPDGDWLCGPCSKGICKGSISCELCASRIGALKPVGNSSTSSEQKWCHLCCALWIPETSIGDLKSMEPIIGIEKIPQARWSLLCYICKLRQGACVQCAVRSCLKAFHVTCAIEHNLKMKTTSSRKHDTRLSTSGCRRSSPLARNSRRTGGSLFIAFCNEHSRRSSVSPERQLHHISKLSPTIKSPSKTTRYLQKIKRNRLTPSKIAKEFYRLVNISQISFSLQIDVELVRNTFMYWRDKRILNNNKPLIDRLPSSKSYDNERWIALHQFLGLDPDQDSSKLILITLRQQLEIARNLCYLISKRERLKRELYSMRVSTAFNIDSDILLAEPSCDFNLKIKNNHAKVNRSFSLFTDSTFCKTAKVRTIDAKTSKHSRETIPSTNASNSFTERRPRGRPRKFPLSPYVIAKEKKLKLGLL